jgi:hypothetical protein
VIDRAETDFGDLLGAMKDAAAALRDGDVPFMLAGGIASWARGGPPTEHDVDFMIKPDDVDRAAAVLEHAGFRIERPPEEWLVKAYDPKGCMVDLIFRPVNTAVDDEMLARGDEIEVQAVTMRVMSADDLLATKLLALSEHNCSYESVLEVGRALREQIDWARVRDRTSSFPFAKAYFVLAEELGLTPQAEGATT